MSTQHTFLPKNAKLLLLILELSSAQGKTLDEMLTTGLLSTNKNPNKKSMERTFYRYLDHLEEIGIKVSSYEVNGDTYYHIDTSLTFADPLQICLTQNDALDLFAITSAYIQNNNLPYISDVQQARNKLAAILGISQLVLANVPNNHQNEPFKEHLYHQCLEAWSHSNPVSFTYCSPTQGTKQYDVQIWGMFDRINNTYLICYDPANPQSDPHMFRIDRIQEQSFVVHNNLSYSVPSDFSLDDYRGLPFSFGSEPAREACFVIQNNADPSYFDVLTESMGTWRRVNNEPKWFVSFKDLKSCALWSAGALTEGLRVCNPPDLVEATREYLLHTVSIHE